MTAEVIVPQGGQTPAIEQLHQETDGNDQYTSNHVASSEATIAAELVKSLLKEPLSESASPSQKYHLPEIPLVDRYVDEPRSLRVAVIGAGLAGVIAGVLLPAKVPGIELTIFEKNADVVSYEIPCS